MKPVGATRVVRQPARQNGSTWIRQTRIPLLWICLAFLTFRPLAAVELAIYPATIQLASSGGAQRVLVVRRDDDGGTQDVTSQCEFHIEPEGKARHEAGVILGEAAGTADLKVQFQDLSCQVPLEIRDAANAAPVGFQHDVIPLFTRYGCNAGTCHGSARGQDGFRLSLFGFDPRGDYHRLTREMAARRIQLAVPEASLMLEKATGSVPHTGGKRFDVDSGPYRVLRNWLAEGANWDEGAPSVVALEVYPPEVVLVGLGKSQRLLVMARYSNGDSRDVSDLAVLRTSDESVAPLTDEGSVSAAKRGESFVTARFDVHTVGIPVVVLPEGLADAAVEPAGNYLDELVLAKLRKLRLKPGPLCSDEAFLRRATLDTTGLLPTRAEYDAFVADTSPQKRAALIDRLLARPEFHQLWAAKWADLLMIRENPNLIVSRKAAQLYFEWLQQQFEQGVPIDKIVHQLLTESGGTFDHPAANFYTVEQDPLKLSENVAQLCLGIRVQCAQCHNHPFDRWTMDDYYGFADFFATVKRKSDEDYREWIVFTGPGETRNPVTGAVMAAKFLGGDRPNLEGVDRRVALADWITSPQNPYFANTLGNRIWAHYLGRGGVEPVDDVRVSNPPSNGPLYTALGQKLIEYGYDLRKLSSDILLSHTYQRAVPAPGVEADMRNFSHARVRRIPATNLLDCISQVTESPEKLRGLPLGSRAVQAVDQAPENYFLTTFGRAQRASVCACESRDEPTLSQALHLINGPSVHEKIKSGGVIARLTAAGLTPEQIIDELHVRCLSRHATPQELEALGPLVASVNPVTEGLEDVFWALLNSPEFVFNH